MDIGALVPALCAVLMFGLSFASWLAKRNNAEARSNREMRAMNVAAVRWIYELDLWAARRGLSLPDRPKELTADYAAAAAEETPSADLAEVAQLFERLGKR